MNDTFKEATERFAAELDALLAEYNEANGYHWTSSTEIVEGRKFFRVLRKDTLGGNSIWFIVDRETGLAYKPKGYSGGPANKIVRGDVTRPAADYWQRTISPHGILDAR
jgi:hypothetical protein